MAESNREEIAKLEALYANNPGGRVFTHLAEAYRKAGELDRARGILEDGITRHAEYASAHVVLGRVLQDLGAREDASAAFRRVLELDPENRVALRSLGDLARDGNHREAALSYFRQLLSLDPTDDQLVRIIDQLNTAVHSSSEAEDAGQPAEESATEEPAQEQSAAASLTEEPDFASASPQSEAAVEPTAERSFGKSAEAPLDPAAESALVETFVTPDIHLDWDSAGDPQSEEPALPGDLAAFAAAEENAAGPEVTPAVEASADPPVAEEIAADPPMADAFAGVQEIDPPGDAEEEDAVESAEEPAMEDPAELLAEEPATEDPADLLDEMMLEVGEFVDIGEDVVISPSGDEGAENPLEAFDTSVLSDAEREPSFEELLSSSRNVPWQEEPESSELQTETLAELYMSQGFNHRAAEVYRSLLERSPGDERLRRRLEEVESHLSPQQPDSGVADEEAGASWSGADETVGDGLDSVWTLGNEPADVAPTLYAWTPEAEDPAGPSIGEYFGQLLAWHPAVTGTSGNGSHHDGGAAATSEFAEPEPPAREGGDPETAFEEVAESAATAGGAASGFEEVEAPKDRDAFVAQESAAPVSPAAPPSMLSQFSAPLNAVEAAFEEWFSGAPAELTAPEPVTAESAATAVPEPAPQSMPAAEVKPPTTPAAETNAAAISSQEESEDDEDLEMFRSWLQGLKR